jgi:hypothetical protein
MVTSASGSADNTGRDPMTYIMIVARGLRASAQRD